MRKILILILAFCTCISQTVYAKDIQSISSESFVLMDGISGTILVEKNSDLKLPPASITKIMTMLLVLESIERGETSFEDVVSVSASAAKHEGSHVFLDVGEQITVDDLLKAVAVASGNDAACALAEHICGSQEAFVQKMNVRAKELGMTNTNYENCNGLDHEMHLTTAKDIATMTFEISKHKEIFRYTGIWMDTLRNDTFDLVNTNKLIRFYDGATGMKTGYTSKAGYCLSATAERNGVPLIAVVMHSPTSAKRFGDASTLLNYGFERFTRYNACKKGDIIKEISVKNGEVSTIEVISSSDVSALVQTDRKKDVKVKISCVESVTAPLTSDRVLGKAQYYLDGRVVGEVDLIPIHSVKKKKLSLYLNSFFTEFFNII